MSHIDKYITICSNCQGVRWHKMKKYIKFTKIRDARKQKGWTLEDLARASGLSFSTVGRVERGEYWSMNSLRKITGALDMSLEELFGAVHLSVEPASDYPPKYFPHYDSGNPYKFYLEIYTNYQNGKRLNLDDTVNLDVEPMIIFALALTDALQHNLRSIGDFEKEVGRLKS